jgi:hypothetical protein
MLTNAQFAAQNKVPAELSPEIEPFAMFDFDLGEMTDENGELLYPHFTGKDVGLYEITPARELTVRQIKEMEDREAELDRQARVELYASRGWAFENPADGGAVDTENEVEDEWEKFFAHDTHRSGGSGRRRGGVKGNSAFEGLVDSAQ